MKKYLFIVLLFGVCFGQDCTADDGTAGVKLWEECYSIENTETISLPCIMGCGGQGLKGPIPPEIGLLTNLTSLNLFYNAVSGPIPPEIGNLVNLTYLNLGYNELSGSIPSEIGNLLNLNYLLLGNNHFSGTIPSEIGNLVNLERLDLIKNQLYGLIPEDICNLPDSVFILNSPHVSSRSNYFCPPYPACIEDSLVQESEYCDNGEECIAGDGTDGLILWDSCYSINNTTAINLSGNNGNDLGELYGPIPSEIGQFLNLDTLNLSINNLSSSIPIELSSLSNLKTLNLHYNKLSGNLPFQIGSLLGLERLYLNYNKLSGSIPNQIGNLSNLIEFHIHQNFISGSIPPEIGNLENLESLFLADNSLTGAIPVELFNLQNLKYLNIRRVPYGMSPIDGNNRFSQSYVFSNIVNLVSIETFIAPDCGLMGTIPSEIGNLQNLIKLNIQDNQLTGIVPESICDLNIDFNAAGFWDRDFNLRGNNLCMPHPSCIVGNTGMSNQDTSNCNIDLNWNFSLSEQIVTINGDDQIWNPGENISIEFDLCNNSDIAHMYYPGIVLKADSQIVSIDNEYYWFYGLDSNSCNTATFNVLADSSINFNTSINFKAYAEALNCENQSEYCIDSDTIAFSIPIIFETVYVYEPIQIPNEFALHQNYPNPFNPITSLRYDLPNDGLVNITIYDMMGRIVKTLVNSSQIAGYKSIQWNATNDRNEPVSAGLYLYTIQAGEFRQTKKMVLLK